MNPEALRKLQVSTLVEMARKTQWAGIRFPVKTSPYREWARGRSSAYLVAARLIDGRVISTGDRRKMGLPLERRAA